MTSRERVRRAIEFKAPDRIPIMHACLPAATEKYGSELQEIMRQYPSDFGINEEMDLILIDRGKVMPTYRKGRYRDEWGAVWQNVYNGILGQVKVHPLQDWKALEDYQFPDPLKGIEFKEVRELIEKSGHQRYIIGWAPSPGYISLFERMIFLRGFETVLIDLVEEREELEVMVDGILNYNLMLIQKWSELDVDGIAFGDDWGTQTQLMVNPKLWREFFKPRYKRMFDLVHEGGKHVHFHSDGRIAEIIPDLIEIGVDVLNPQHSIMDLSELKKMVKGKICIRSDIDCQYVLPYGTEQEVKNHIKEVIKAFSDYNGGLILHGEIQPSILFSNVRAMYETFWKYGRYPLEWIENEVEMKV